MCSAHVLLKGVTTACRCRLTLVSLGEMRLSAPRHSDTGGKRGNYIVHPTFYLQPNQDCLTKGEGFPNGNSKQRQQATPDRYAFYPIFFLPVF